ncbi:hypothetical protein SAMN04487897_101931 [Paenibacillus sp. yr247]|uniref:hypothetical protein n=1 Tax=Paenibacillus sp. yr247 TaxID=1761880 RepID=UPI000891413E|nr:hypothetical protein [Paenibacillus sp. yr247]SDN05764.1 hypothetical protein SAMN04487897_101931 [Paenibacillus sp. yr247]
MLYALVRLPSFLLGLYIVITTIGSIIDTLILTRRVKSRISITTGEGIRYLFKVLTYRTSSYEHKDRLLSYLGPLALLTNLVTWMGLFILGYALMLWPLIDKDFMAALELAGSSFFTLGIFQAPRGLPMLLSFAAAASGMITVALQIGYLPTLYSAYNRRETLVTALGIRTRRIAWGPGILAHHYREGQMRTLPELFAAWEIWAADITESHVSYPWLKVFRSPNKMNSWVVSLLAMMDAASLYLVLDPPSAPPQAKQCLRAGITCMRTLTNSHEIMIGGSKRAGMDKGAIPLVSLAFEEFKYGIDQLERSGFPIDRSLEEVWEEFVGWRLQYEYLAYRLADFVVAVPAPWSGSREHMTPETILPSVMLPTRT